MPVLKHKGLVVVTRKDSEAFNAWLEANHEQEEAIWVRFAKKASKKKTPTYEEARERAIAWGWIDGLINRWDDDYYVIRFSRRRKKSNWSRINRGIAEQLIKDGRMEEPGMAEVKAAKKDGRWAKAYAD